MKLWILFSLLSIANATILVLLIKYISFKYNSDLILFFTMLLATIFLFIHNLYNKKFNFETVQVKYIILILVCGISSYLTNLFWAKAIVKAPNLGYAMAIFDIRTVLIAVLSVVFFNSELSLIHFVGIIITFIGIRLITL